MIDNDFIPSLIMSQCHDMRSSTDIYRVLQVDDEGGQGKKVFFTFYFQISNTRLFGNI